MQSFVTLSYQICQWVVIYLELSATLYSTSLTFVFKSVLVPKPLVSVIILSTSPVFFSIFFYSCCTDLCELK